MAIPFVGLAATGPVDSYLQKKNNDVLDDLTNACGEDSLLPYFTGLAEKGNKGAQAWLAQAYDRGEGVQKDPAQAVHWYGLAAAQGDTDAEVNLGAHYAAGEGVPKDEARAATLWQAAAERRVPEAETDLGSLYLAGQGVAQDYAKAAYYLRLAAKQGHGSAQFMLGEMYEEGVGVPRSDLIVYRWYSLATKNGETRANQKRTTLAAKLSDADKAIADQQAQHCVDTLYMDCV